MKRKRKKAPLASLVILAAAIVLLNFSGISYASWSDKLSVYNKVLTGKIEPYFSSIKINKLKGEGELEAPASKNDDYTIYIEGTVKKGYEAEILYDIKNRGTIPVEFTKEEVPVSTGGGLTITLNQSTNAINPDSYSSSDSEESKLHIKASDVGEYDFEVKLPFVCKDGGDRSWKKTLTIKGKITVEPKSKADPASVSGDQPDTVNTSNPESGSTGTNEGQNLQAAPQSSEEQKQGSVPENSLPSGEGLNEDNKTEKSAEDVNDTSLNSSGNYAEGQTPPVN